MFARRRRSRARRFAGWLPVGIVLVVAVSLVTVRALNADLAPLRDPGSVHVHALGLEAESQSLFIATHNGLYRLPPGKAMAEPTSDRHQDTMGFAVAAPGYFLGSGHPDLRDDLPPLLGLIESRDAGETWQPVSLLGEVDFHVLRVEGRHIVGYDATRGRILASGDEGRTWNDRKPPERLPRSGRPSEIRTMVRSSVRATEARSGSLAACCRHINRCEQAVLRSGPALAEPTSTAPAIRSG